MQDEISEEVLEARRKLAEKAGNSRIGGAGSMRRKKKAQHKVTVADDKKLSMALRKMNVNPLPDVEEANLFKDDNTVIHFQNPHIRASIRDNIFVIAGRCETKPLRDLLPQLLDQIGPQNRQFLIDFVNKSKNDAEKDNNDEDDVPELEEGNFEEFNEKQEMAINLLKVLFHICQ
jgi:nascent polypeptide-associated complex subunit beta